MPFAKATTRQLEKAIEGLRAKPTAHDDALAAWAKGCGAKLQAAVAAPKGSHSHAPRLRAYPHPDGQKTLRFDLVGVDLDDLERIAHALLHVKLPRGPRGAAKTAA